MNNNFVDTLNKIFNLSKTKGKQGKKQLRENFSLGPMCITDCSSSSSSTSSITNNVLNQQITDILNASDNTFSSTTTGLQSITFNYPPGSTMNCATIGISQDENISVKLVTKISSTNAANIQNTINNAITSAANAASAANTQFLSGAGATAMSATDVSNLLTNIASTSVSQTLSSNVLETFDFTQVQVINMPYVMNGTSCTWNQNMQLSLVADTILNNVNSAFASDSTVSAITSTAASTSTATAGGIQGVIDSVFKGLASLFSTGLIFIILIIGAVLFFGYKFLFHGSSPSSSNSTKSSTSVPTSVSSSVSSLSFKRRKHIKF